ncbi:MAG: hypothetical protein M3N43_14015 [Actinomycetota bacterium]|nr:hypothetical protein [Actinomycetota bacterium]
MRRVTAGTLTLILVVTLLLIQVTTAPPAAAASISVSPGSGQPGIGARVDGSAFLLLVNVDLCWDSENCSDLGSVNPDALGNFNVGITIPGIAATGTHTINACQEGLGCTSTSFQVMSSPATSTTIPATTTTSAPTTTTTLPTTTSTAPVTTTTPPGPTTTRPGPTTTTTSPPPTVTTTTVPGQGGSSGSTSTTDGFVFTTETTLPLPEASAAPFSLDIKALVARLFAPDPEAPIEGAAAPESVVAFGSPLTPVTEPGDEAEEESGLALGDPSAGSSGFQPRFGIWLIWLVVVLGMAGLALTVDEMRRKRDRR